MLNTYRKNRKTQTGSKASIFKTNIEERRSKVASARAQIHNILCSTNKALKHEQDVIWGPGLVLI